MAHSKDFSGKIALVTGSSSGIGEEIALQFSKYGAQVIITGRNDERIVAVAEKCTQISPKQLKALGIKCDIGNDKEVQALVTNVIDTFGKLDILVNNAGIAPFASITDPGIMAMFDNVMRSNLRAPFLLTNLLVPHLIQTKGNVVNISSTCGLHSSGTSPVYCSSKAALDMFTNPGWVRTPIFDSMGLTADLVEIAEKQFKEEYPLRRMGEVNDVAKMVMYLASEDASFVTGLVAQVDGGGLHVDSGGL